MPLCHPRSFPLFLWAWIPQPCISGTNVNNFNCIALMSDCMFSTTLTSLSLLPAVSLFSTSVFSLHVCVWVSVWVWALSLPDEQGATVTWNCLKIPFIPFAHISVTLPSYLWFGAVESISCTLSSVWRNISISLPWGSSRFTINRFLMVPWVSPLCGESNPAGTIWPAARLDPLEPEVY